MLTPAQFHMLHEARIALHLSMNGLAEALGASRRTGQRWSAGRSTPSDPQLHRLVALVHPRDPDLAASLAAASGTTLQALGLVLPAPAGPPAPAPVPDRIVDAVVCAAAEAMDMTPRAVRPAVAAAFAAARELGLTVEGVDQVLGRRATADRVQASKKVG